MIGQLGLPWFPGLGPAAMLTGAAQTCSEVLGGARGVGCGCLWSGMLRDKTPPVYTMHDLLGVFPRGRV